MHRLKIALSVGIRRGVPYDGETTQDIRLGYVIVSAPGEERGGVISNDSGNALADANSKHSGHLNRLPILLLTAVTTLAYDFDAEGGNIAKASHMHNWSRSHGPSLSS